MKKLMSIFLLLAASCVAAADVAVVVSVDNASAVSTDDLKRIFLGKQKKYSGGDSIELILQNASNTLDGEFNEKVLSRSPKQMKAYWSKLIFTGKGSEPKRVAGDADVVAAIAASPNAIGYVEPASVNDSVKVVATF